MNYKNPRPTEKPITALMLEYIGESNEWEWYSILFDCTPFEAIQNYLYENNEDEYILDNFNKTYNHELEKIEIDNVRAYYITI